MVSERTENTEREIDLPALCRTVADASPIAIAGVVGPTHTLRYVNLAFCLLTGKAKEELIGTAFGGVVPGTKDCLLLLDRVARTGLSESHTGQEDGGTLPLKWSFAMWPLRRVDHSRLGIMVQVTKAAKFHDDMVAMNQALLLGSVRQHELTEAAELLTEQLQAAIVVAKKAEEALISSEKLASAGRMAAVLAHEINNPLAAVTNLLFLAQTSADTPGQSVSIWRWRKASLSESPTSLVRRLASIVNRPRRLLSRL